MILILDYISSIVIYSALALVLASTQLRVQQTAIQQTVVYASKKHTLEFADTIEREFKMIGAGIDNRVDMITALQTDGDGNASSFAFSWVDASDVQHDVVYSMDSLKTVPIAGDNVTLYQVIRTDNGVDWAVSPGTINRFQITMLDGSGGAATIGNAELIRISFANTFAYGDLDSYFMPETNWGITLRPLNLVD